MGDSSSPDPTRAVRGSSTSRRALSHASPWDGVGSVASAPDGLLARRALATAARASVAQPAHSSTLSARRLPTVTLATGAAGRERQGLRASDEPLRHASRRIAHPRDRVFTRRARFLAVGTSGAAAVFGLPSGALSFRIDGAGPSGRRPGARSAALATGGPDGVGRVRDVLKRGRRPTARPRRTRSWTSPSVLDGRSSRPPAPTERRGSGARREGLVARSSVMRHDVLGRCVQPDGRGRHRQQRRDRPHLADGQRATRSATAGRPSRSRLLGRESIARNGRRVLTWSADGTARPWDRRDLSPRPLRSVACPANAARAAIAASAGVAPIAGDRRRTIGHALAAAQLGTPARGLAQPRTAAVGATGRSAASRRAAAPVPARGKLGDARHGVRFRPSRLDPRRRAMFSHRGDRRKALSGRAARTGAGGGRCR